MSAKVEIESKKKRAFWSLEDKYLFLKVFVSGFLIISVSKGLPNLFSDEVKGWILVNIFLLFLKETGVALMIAAVLGYTVESLARKKQTSEFKRFQEQIGEDVLSAVFKKIIPDSIFKEVKRSVLDQTLIKENAHMSYVLSPISTEKAAQFGLTDEESLDILMCDITTTHTLRNLSDLKVSNHPIRCGVSCDLNEKLSKHLIIHQATIGDELAPDEIKNHVSQGKGAGVKEFMKEVTLEKGEKITVSFCTRTFKKSSDTEVWTTLSPTEGMELEVSYPVGFEVGAKASHPEELVPSPPNKNVPKRTFKLDHGIFPYQGITFWWSRSKGS